MLGSTINLFASRKKRDETLVNEQGEPLPTRMPVLWSWCRIAIVASLVPPPEGQWFAVSVTGRTLRLTIHAPKTVVYTAITAALGCVPWVRDAAVWCFTHWK